MDYRWKNLWVDNGDGTYTNTFTDYDSEGEEYTSTNVNKFVVYAQMAEYLPLGASTAHVERGTRVSQDGVLDDTNYSWVYSATRSIVSLIEEFEVEGNSFTDCALIEDGGNWDGIMIHSIHCAGIGIVAGASGSYREGYALVSYEHTEENSARTYSNQENTNMISYDRNKYQLQKYLASK
ncbi:hypothetical protein [Vibrio astriarenae]|uniref:hypothetical protein n=1 Tax=Vibrio astriarenae TaxID=1481923 RepID=UPI0037359AFC